MTKDSATEWAIRYEPYNKDKHVAAVLTNYTNQPIIIADTIMYPNISEHLFHHVHGNYPTSKTVLGQMLLNEKCPMSIVLYEYYHHPSLRPKSATRIAMFNDLWEKEHIKFLTPHYPEMEYSDMPLGWLQELIELIIPESEEPLTL